MKKEQAKLLAKPFKLEPLENSECKIPKRVKKKRNKNKEESMKAEIYDRCGPKLEKKENIKEYLKYLKEKKIDVTPYEFDEEELKLLNLIENERQKLIDYFDNEILENFDEMKNFNKELNLRQKEIQKLIRFFKNESKKMVSVNKKRSLNIKKYK